MGGAFACCDSQDDMRPAAGTHGALARANTNDNKITVEYFAPGYGRSDPIVQMLTHAKADWEFKGVSQ